MSHQFVRFWSQIYWSGLPFPPPECQRIDAFKLWCWRRLLKDSRTARRANQSVLNQPWILVGRTDAEAEAPVFWSSDANSWLIGKVPDAGKDWGQKERGHQRMRWLGGITIAMDLNLGTLQEMLRDSDTWCAAIHRVAKNRTWLSNWTSHQHKNKCNWGRWHLMWKI